MTSNTAIDILNGTAKMYAGVKGEIKTTPDKFTPISWVYRLSDNDNNTLENNRSLTAIALTDTVAAEEMYNQIVKLAETKWKSTKKENYKRLGTKIPVGGWMGGQRFQLLFKYTPVDKPALVTAEAAAKSAKDAADAAATDTALATTAKTTRAAADALKLQGTGFIRYGNSDTDIKSFSVKDGVVTTTDDANMVLSQLLVDLLDENMTIGGKEKKPTPMRTMGGAKSARRKRKMGSSKKPITIKRKRSGASRKNRSYPKRK